MTNLLLLFCDQLRADVLGCYGHPFAVTPAMDGLAARGTVYDRAYTPSPVCRPGPRWSSAPNRGRPAATTTGSRCPPTGRR
jgi:hypothetical protein